MIFRHDLRHWGPDLGAVVDQDLTVELESGAILLLPALPFEVSSHERTLFSPSIAGAKNVSFDPRTGKVSYVKGGGPTSGLLTDLLTRFHDASAALVSELFPAYRDRIERGRASFRPVEIAGRKTSWRSDDTRLHVDSFFATPVQGRRILRVFTNVNPNGQVRSWRVGEPFARVAARFSGQLRIPHPAASYALRLIGMTKSRRAPYDWLMLQLHDRMKADLDYQQTAEQSLVDFPAGSTWLAFTDEVSHAATSGQYQLEQTFVVPIDAMREPWRSPLRILERLKGRELA
jgi:hypothetical protein